MDQIWILTDEEKRTVSSLVIKWKEEQKRNEGFSLIDFNSFYKLFNKKEIDIIEKFLSIDPKKFKYKLPFLGYTDVPSDIISLLNQPYKIDGNPIPCQYLPEKIYKAYEKMNKALYKDIGKKLGVLYGYRSPARQVFTFFDILKGEYHFDFNKTINRVAFPDYSEHVCIQKQAVDFVTEEGICEGFEKTKEYNWLQNNAKRFGFFESYPKDNLLDMMYEPWHWHFEE